MLAKAPRPAVSQRICAEYSLGQEVKQLAVRSLWGREQVYLCKSEMSPNELDRLGMESSLSGESSSWQLIGCPVEQARNVNGTKRPQMLLTPGGGGGRVATCDGSVDHLVGWCTRQSQCWLYGPVRARLVSVSWDESRPGLLPAILGISCASAGGARPNPRHCKPVEHSLVIGIRVNHSMPGDLFQGHSCLKNRRIVWPWGEGLAASQFTPPPHPTSQQQRLWWQCHRL